MRLIPSLLAALALVAGCGTKTPLTLPPQTRPATVVPSAPAPVPAPAVDHSNKAADEPRQ